MANITNLKGTTWAIPGNWQDLLPAIYDVGGYQYCRPDHMTSNIVSFDQFRVGYYNGSVSKDGICFYDSSSEKYSSYFWDSNFGYLYVTFTSGKDLTNSSLISWLNKYGTGSVTAGDVSCANTIWTITNAGNSPSGKYSMNGRVTKKDGTVIDFTEFAVGYGRWDGGHFDSTEGSVFSFWNSNTKEWLNIYSADDLPLTIHFYEGLSANQINLNSWLETNGTLQTEEPDTPITSGMKLEVLYKGEVIGSLLAGESITLHLNGRKLIDDLVVRAVADEVTPEEQIYTITAGTYIFKETLDTSIDVFIGVDPHGIGCTYYTGHGLFESCADWIRITDGVMDFGDNTGLRYVYYSKDGWTYTWRTNYESEALYGEIPKEYLLACRTITFEQDIETDRDFYEWFIANAVPKPKLSAPTITINGAVITITDTSDLATEFCFYSNRVTLFYTADTVVDLSEMLLEPFGAGAYNITVTALADGYEESDHSNEVECVVTERTYELSGTWTFKTSGLTYVGDDNYGITKTDPIGFTSNGKTFYRFMTNPSSFTGEAYSSLDYANLNGYTRTTVQKSNTGWVNTNYKTVTFNGTWTVDERFYKWYIANMECPIKFTIAGVTYGADANMTWGEWLESKYNTGKFVSRGLNVATNDSQYAVRATNNVLDDEIITNGYSYSLYYVGGHGGSSWD